MVLLAPGWMLLLLLVIPIILLNTRHRKTVIVGSVSAWRTVKPVSSRRFHWRWPPLSPLLLLQIAIVLSLAFALAQPRLNGGNLPDHTIFVLDSSASMRAQDIEPTRFSAARKMLETELPLALRAGLVSIISVNAGPHIISARQSRLPAVRPRLSELAPTDAVPNWRGTAEWIDILTRDNEGTVVRLLTDEQGSLDIQESDDRQIVETIFGTTNIANASLNASVAPVPEVAGRWRLSGVAASSSSDFAPPELTVRYARLGLEGELDWARIPLNWETRDGGAFVASFDVELEFPGQGRLTISLPDDQAPADNANYFILASDAHLEEVLIIGEEQAELVHALGAAGATSVSHAASLPEDDSTFDLVIVNGVTVPRKPATNVLWLGPARINGAPGPGPLTTSEVTGWSSSHPLSEGLQWAQLAAQPLYPVTPVPGISIVAEAGGYPLLQAQTTLEGREVFLSIDLSTAPFRTAPAFPILMANLVRWIRGEFNCRVGSPCQLPARYLPGIVTAPDGTHRNLGPSGQAGFIEHEFVPHLAGFYRLERRGIYLDIAVNPPTGQGTDLVARGTQDLPAPSALFEWWWWLAVIAGLLLIAEMIVRPDFFSPPRWRRSGPGAARCRWGLGMRFVSLGLVALSLLGVPVLVREEGNVIVAVLDPLPGAALNLSRLEEAGARSAGAISTDFDVPLRLGGPSARTDLARGLALAQAMLPADRKGRIVLASSGNDTTGNLAGALSSLSAPLDLYPLSPMPPGEVLVESVSVPPHAAAGQVLPGKATIFSNGDGTAHVSILHDGLPVRSENITLHSGSNSIGFELRAPSKAILVEAMVQSDRDTFKQNNRGGTLVEFIEPAPVLIVAQDAAEAQLFARALRVQEIGSRIVAPNAAPRVLSDWLNHSLVVLLNTPALALTMEQQAQLVRAVEQHGRGLLVLGGENAFGAGGYYETPLEDVSPLSSRVPHDAPQAALVFVLDRSGSMAGEVGAVTRLAIAKGAITRAIELLTPESLVGVVAFDELALTALPLTLRGAEGALSDAIARITPGGGTRLSPGLLSAVEQLEKIPASVKHVIVVTDGLIEPLDFSHILERARTSKITVSTIAVGTSAITDRLEDIAELGDGTYYATREFEALPSILSQDIMRLSEPLRREELVPVVFSGDRPGFLAQLPPQMPPLTSYVRTTLKDGAELHMAASTGEDEVPILASWRYGSGRVMAFAAHAAGSGTREWMEMSGFPRMWAQAVRHFLPDVLGPGMHLSLRRAGDEVIVTTDLIDLEGEPISAQIVAASFAGSETHEMLAELAAGRYRGAFQLPHIGDHAISVSVGAITKTARIHVPYPARYEFTRADPDYLTRFVKLTGGRVLTDADDVFTPEASWGLASAPWFWLLPALGLFAAELVLRQGAVRLPRLGRGKNGR